MNRTVPPHSRSCILPASIYINRDCTRPCVSAFIKSLPQIASRVLAVQQTTSGICSPDTGGLDPPRHHCQPSQSFTFKICHGFCICGKEMTSHYPALFNQAMQWRSGIRQHCGSRGILFTPSPLPLMSSWAFNFCSVPKGTSCTRAARSRQLLCTQENIKIFSLYKCQYISDKKPSSCRLFISGLFNDAVSISEYVVSNVRVI
jgi:hypothetical protein